MTTLNCRAFLGATPFAVGAAPKTYEGKEFTGATFSPGGQTLFVNIQTPGLTLAIWGPWERGAL